MPRPPFAPAAMRRLLLALASCVPALALAQRTVPPAAEQIAAAVLPLPADLRAGATVLGYDATGRLATLRTGTNAMRCLADEPGDDRFHVACYHREMEPFMARGRALRAAGVLGDQVDSVRFREIRQRRLRMPSGAWPLYSLSGPASVWDAAAGTATGARPLFVLYLPYATTASTGVSDKPGKGPWLMFPGTPKAHLMITPDM